MDYSLSGTPLSTRFFSRMTGSGSLSLLSQGDLPDLRDQPCFMSLHCRRVLTTSATWETSFIDMWLINFWAAAYRQWSLIICVGKKRKGKAPGHLMEEDISKSQDELRIPFQESQCIGLPWWSGVRLWIQSCSEYIIVQSLVGELRSHMPQGQEKRRKPMCDFSVTSTEVQRSHLGVWNVVSIITTSCGLIAHCFSLIDWSHNFIKLDASGQSSLSNSLPPSPRCQQVPATEVTFPVEEKMKHAQKEPKRENRSLVSWKTTFSLHSNKNSV